MATTVSVTADQAGALEIVETGEIVQPMGAEEASSITTQIVVKLDAIADNYQAVMPLIREAITRQAHLALGYASAGAYVSDRFGKALSRLGIDTRRQVVKELTEAGLSTRAIAPIVGVSHKTIVTDRQVVPAVPPESSLDDDPALTDEECEALADPMDLGDDEPYDDEPEPGRTTGIDGKSYPKPTPQLPRSNRRPITDAFRSAAYDLGKKVKTLTNLAADDRFNKNADQLAERNLSELIRARDALQRVIDQLPN